MVLEVGCVNPVAGSMGIWSAVLGMVTAVWLHEWVRRGEVSEPSTFTCPEEMIPCRFSESTQHWLGVGRLNSCMKAYPTAQAYVVSLGGKHGLPAE